MKDSKTINLKDLKRIVVKVGTSILTDSRGILEVSHISDIVEDLFRLRRFGLEVVLVTSGAIGAGVERLKLKRRPQKISLKQAAAACGQSRLMHIYEDLFFKHSQEVAQVLLTHRDLSERKSHLNARETLLVLLQHGIIPIINENDTVAFEEIKFGDNDTLAALVTNLLEADLLIILTDIDGLYEEHSNREAKGRLIEVIEEVTDKILNLAGSKSGELSIGGMLAKVQAAQMATKGGAYVIIANGMKPGILTQIFAGEKVGTLFLPQIDRTSRRKCWIGFNLKPSGQLIIDDGAKEAILKQGKSLLSSGIREIKGDFERGEAVAVLDLDGRELARGLTNYSQTELDKIRGKHSSEIEGILGYKYDDEAIHRDNLVLL
ncbi:TPA: glutamate 5-kinase [bacterium]|nr:glutamate 5-kinase [bacterium]